MPSFKPHIYGKIGLAGIGWVAELESFDVSLDGTPTPLRALEGTVGFIFPVGKEATITGVVFNPTVKHAYSTMMKYWYEDTIVEMFAEVGTKFIAVKGCFDGPKTSDNGSKTSFSFMGVITSMRDL
jgi:hypothetical protein